MKVVFHVDEMEKWQVATGNISNLLKLQPDAEIVLVANGSGIQSYELKQARAFIAAHPTVAFHACQNAMNSHNLTAEDLPAGVQIVPAGVLDLIELQEQGFAYIKP